jgi:hypothetical protein
MKVKSETVSGQCPVCGLVLPFGTVTAQQVHWWKVQLHVKLDFDYTDYVAHMWLHQ